MAVRPRPSVRAAIVSQVLAEALGDRERTGTLRVLDAGGGSGVFAVPLAERGHHVTVVDPSPDSLAALVRRAAESGVADRVTARQGDFSTLAELVGAGGHDLVLCHNVLEVVDDPAAALAAATTVLAPGGAISLLAPNRTAAVFARALLGHIDQARTALADPRGRWGPADVTLRRFDLEELLALLAGAGLVAESVHGVRIFADLLAGAGTDGDPGAADALVDLELAASTRPDFRAVATQLHVLARRS